MSNRNAPPNTQCTWNTTLLLKCRLNVRSLANVLAIKFQSRISDNVQQECSSQYSLYVKYNTVTEVQVTEVGYLQQTRRTRNPSLHIVFGSAISSNVVRGTLLLKESKPIRESQSTPKWQQMYCLGYTSCRIRSSNTTFLRMFCGWS